jgi:outer membrane receptor for ferrienterochelin and colicin
MRRFLLSGAVIALSAPPVAAADSQADLSLEQLLQVEVSGASRYAQPLAEAPATATVLTAEDIRRHAFRDLGEAL